jgi:WW domain
MQGREPCTETGEFQSSLFCVLHYCSARQALITFLAAFCVLVLPLQRCHRCKAKKPADGGNYVMDAAFKQALDGGTISPWQEALDPKTQHIYYCNTQTGETTWSRPESMGAAPHATGWFGRGSIHKVYTYSLCIVMSLVHC